MTFFTLETFSVVLCSDLFFVYDTNFGLRAAINATIDHRTFEPHLKSLKTQTDQPWNITKCIDDKGDESSLAGPVLTGPRSPNNYIHICSNYIH